MDNISLTASSVTAIPRKLNAKWSLVSSQVFALEYVPYTDELMLLHRTILDGILNIIGDQFIVSVCPPTYQSEPFKVLFISGHEINILINNSIIIIDDYTKIDLHDPDSINIIIGYIIAIIGGYTCSSKPEIFYMGETIHV